MITTPRKPFNSLTKSPVDGRAQRGAQLWSIYPVKLSDNIITRRNLGPSSLSPREDHPRPLDDPACPHTPPLRGPRDPPKRKATLNTYIIANPQVRNRACAPVPPRCNGDADYMGTTALHSTLSCRDHRTMELARSDSGGQGRNGGKRWSTEGKKGTHRNRCGESETSGFER